MSFHSGLIWTLLYGSFGFIWLFNSVKLKRTEQTWTSLFSFRWSKQIIQYRVWTAITRKFNYCHLWRWTVPLFLHIFPSCFCFLLPASQRSHQHDWLGQFPVNSQGGAHTGAQQQLQRPPSGCLWLMHVSRNILDNDLDDMTQGCQNSCKS